MSATKLTIPQLITKARLIINDRSRSDKDVLDTIEHCLEEPFEEGEDLNKKLLNFERSYHSWIAYHREQAAY